jgi:hypothetical protein
VGGGKNKTEEGSRRGRGGRLAEDRRRGHRRMSMRRIMKGSR